MPHPPVRRAALLSIAPWLALMVAANLGCERGPQLPKTYPVSGKATMKGGQPWTLGGASLTFQLTSDPSVVAVGIIDQQGAFTVTTNMYGKEKAGAAAGEHTVMVEPPPPPGEAFNQSIVPQVLDKTVLIEAKDMNEVSIEVEPF